MRADFVREHERLYGHRSDPDNPVEVVAVRLVGQAGVRGLGHGLETAVQPVAGEGSRTAYFAGETLAVPLVNRQDLDQASRGAPAHRRTRFHYCSTAEYARPAAPSGPPPHRSALQLARIEAMTAIDPITREIVRNALASAADEMAMALYRTAYSTIVRDCLDYSTSLCDAEGQMIAQGVTIPLHLGSVPFAMETLLAKYGNDIEEGDVFILNDPFEGGMHIPDIFIVQPVFSEGQRVAFAVSTAHHLDLGGRLPGSSACDNTEIFQEGLRIPWLKLYRRGEADEALFALIRANVRVPQMTIGDLRAQLAACHIGAPRPSAS